MTPLSRGQRRAPSSRRLLLFALLVLPVALALSACSGQTTASFDPTAPCATDTRVPGAFPDMEALIPKTLTGAQPKNLDSGRNCSAVNLGTLATHGINEVRFAGGVWADANQSAVTLAAFSAPGLRAEWLAEWFEASARAARQTGNITLTKPTVGGKQAQRMDLVNGESAQTVITWQGPGVDTVYVVLAAEEPEARIQEAIAAFGK